MEKQKSTLFLWIALCTVLTVAPAWAGYWCPIDQDGDGWCVGTEVVADTPPPGYGPCGDCDDTNPHMFPGNPEIPCDGYDNGCMGIPDTAFQDLDQDGFGSTVVIWIEGDCSPANYASWLSTDCDDTAPAIHPGAEEVPNDGIDQDCNGEDLVDPVPLKGTPWSLLKTLYR